MTVEPPSRPRWSCPARSRRRRLCAEVVAGLVRFLARETEAHADAVRPLAAAVGPGARYRGLDRVRERRRTLRRWRDGYGIASEPPGTAVRPAGHCENFLRGLREDLLGPRRRSTC
ncbi:hypothetical protein BFF78_25905 [Streptomyces fodineus]|uniref:Uncharacterized protein n=1 Tax=Streptomyces fodineus TaxID=1904616 RepID=A0A1D7YEI2_9ACTN|nr:hypothetical protein [Streptomyces fodineus]AOR34027.1 hypothetical protein BFF78_25905 [Streptomyces fodineus]